jgi:hypothetical protein
MEANAVKKTKIEINQAVPGNAKVNAKNVHAASTAG